MLKNVPKVVTNMLKNFPKVMTNMLKIVPKVVWASVYAYKRYAYKKHVYKNITAQIDKKIRIFLGYFLNIEYIDIQNLITQKESYSC